jgi:hypothetical protein
LCHCRRGQEYQGGANDEWLPQHAKLADLSTQELRGFAESPSHPIERELALRTRCCCPSFQILRLVDEDAAASVGGRRSATRASAARWKRLIDVDRRRQLNDHGAIHCPVANRLDSRDFGYCQSRTTLEWCRRWSVIVVSTVGAPARTSRNASDATRRPRSTDDSFGLGDDGSSRLPKSGRHVCDEASHEQRA